MFAIVSFCVMVAGFGFAYRKELAAFLAARKTTSSNTTTPPVFDTVAALVNVTKLRQQLSDDGCTVGVKAATALLQAILEHKYKQQPSGEGA